MELCLRCDAIVITSSVWTGKGVSMQRCSGSPRLRFPMTVHGHGRRRPALARHARPLHGLRMAFASPSPGRCMANAWPLHGLSARPPHGCCMVVSSPAHNPAIQLPIVSPSPAPPALPASAPAAILPGPRPALTAASAFPSRRGSAAGGRAAPPSPFLALFLSLLLSEAAFLTIVPLNILHCVTIPR